MKSITQRRIFSLLLSLAMLVGLLPTLGSIASAAGSGTTEGDPRIVTTYAELSSALSSGVTYIKLGANINTKELNDGAGYTKSIQQTGTVQLDLDGYSVTFFSRTSPLPAAIRVTGDLSVKDSRGGGKLYIDANPNTTSSKQVLIHAETGSFTLNSGRIGVDNGLAKNSIVVVEGKGDAKVVFNGGKVDAIIVTGGIAHDTYCVDRLRPQVEYMAPVVVMPGENEMLSLAFNALGALRGELELMEYTGDDCREGIVSPVVID